jgi:hypothetical protein
MSVSAFALTGIDVDEGAALEGSLNFAVTNTIGSFLAVIGIALVYARTGALNIAQAGHVLDHGHVDGLVVVALAFLFVIKPLMAKVSAGVSTSGLAVATASGARPRTVAELEGEIAAQLDAAETKGDRKLPVLTKRVADGAMKEPEHVAKVLRSWMKEEVR